MKNFIWAVIFLIFTANQHQIVAQKFDNQWVFGYFWENNDAIAETYRLVFDTFPPRIVKKPGLLNPLSAYTSICDSAGNLQLTTNNCFIANSNGDYIGGGTEMMYSWEGEWCNKYRWHPLNMQNMMLPHPKKDKLIYSFYKSTYKSTSGPLKVYNDKYKYAVVELNSDGLNHKVISKDSVLVKDVLGALQTTAVKHSNGRDWWLPVPVKEGNKFYTILFGADSIYVHHEQQTAQPWNSDGGFQASFSPDGSKYARYNRFNGVYIYDFDRCSGLLGKLVHFPMNDTTQGITGGCAFSPNNRFLYLCDKDYVYQFDLEVADIESSRQIVAKYDGFRSLGIWTDFYLIVNAPDGRMYITTPNTTQHIHVINRPNLPGLACDVRQHDIEFPNPYGNTPNFPNFRLGPLDGSPCDTLGWNNLPLANFRPEASDSSARTLWFWDISDYRPTEWHWDFGDPASGTANTASTPDAAHTYPAPGFYTVCLTVKNEYASDTKCKVVEIKSSSTDTPASGWLRLYPNPTTGMVYLPENEGVEQSIRVFDGSGRCVLDTRITGNSIDISTLPAGMYLLRLTRLDDGRTMTGKVLKK